MDQDHDRDRKIFEVFVRENEGALIAYIRTFTRDAQIAEDLFQETMLIAWRKFDEFDSRGSLSAWLRGIAKNLIRDDVDEFYRKMGKRGSKPCVVERMRVP